MQVTDAVSSNDGCCASDNVNDDDGRTESNVNSTEGTSADVLIIAVLLLLLLLCAYEEMG